jgi:hypothetical protein
MNITANEVYKIMKNEFGKYMYLKLECTLHTHYLIKDELSLSYKYHGQVVNTPDSYSESVRFRRVPASWI